MSQLHKRLQRTDALFCDLVSVLTPQQLASDLGGLPSNTIGAQLWCVVGARESYARAALAGSWQGFTCRLSSEETRDSAAILSALAATVADVLAAAGRVEPGSAAEDFMLDLLEHEVQHHGQLIRYLYALGIERPSSWKERYALV